MIATFLKSGIIYKEHYTQNGKKVILRAPLWSDLDPLLEFANALAEEVSRNPNLGIGQSEKQTRDGEALWLGNLLREIELDRQVSVVAICEEKLVGSSRIVRNERKDMAHLGILHIALLDEYRGFGIGSEMIKILLKECIKIGIKIVELEVFAINEGAVKLYQKFGFKQVGLMPKEIFRGGKYIDIIIMSIEL